MQTRGRYRPVASEKPETEPLGSAGTVSEMQKAVPDRALAWRLELRQLFETYLASGYRAVDFVLQREAGFGRYLLARD